MAGSTAAQPPLGLRLRTLRHAAGLTQEELAERAGLTVHAVSALERGTRTRPHPHTVRALARALDASESDVVRLRAAAHPTVAVEIPEPVLPLIGRDAELAALQDRLRSGSARLVTLCGPGGVGKTRLALAAARGVADAFPDGVAFVALAALAGPELVVTEVGRALGVAGAVDLDALVAHLRPQRRLLVLDNMEHVAGAAPAVVTLLEGCPELTVLVTSRSSLRVRAETEHPVAPLALPEHADPAGVAASAAGALFVDRARAVRPGFALTPDTATAVHAICHRLAGIPLAIELAAARLRYLGPGDLLGRLHDAMARDGALDLPERHRTLRATIDWSYRLLGPAEQQLFRRLAVFAGGFDLAAAEEVGSCRPPCELVHRADVLGLLEALVEQSLIVADTAAGRYRLLGPIAHHARLLLEAGDEAPAVQRAHVEHYLDLAHRADAGFRTADQVRWLRRIDAEHANTVAAVERALGAGDAESAARLCSALSLYWWVGGHLVLGRRLTHAALEGELPEPVRIRALIAEATMAFAQDDHGAAARIWQRALDLARSCGDVAGQAHALPGLGVAALVTGDLGVAETAFRTTLMLAEAVGAEGEWVAALTEVWLGTVLVHRDDREGAVQHITRGLESARRRGDLLTSYIALYNLAQVADDQAPERLREGIELAVQTRDAANLAHFLEALAVAETPLGAPRRVAVLLGAAGALLEQAGFQVYGYYLPDTARRDAAASAARDALGPDGYDDAVDEGRALGLDGAVAYALGR